MDRADITFWLSIAAFGTSFVLAVLKIFEFYDSHRTVLTADVRLTGSSDIGNTIVLLNKSSIPVTISYFELVWFERRKLFGCPIPFTNKVTFSDSPVAPEYGYDESIGPHATHALNFTGDHHYNWGFDTPLVYLKVWLIGRKSALWFIANRTK